MYSARHCQLGLSRTRYTRPDTVDLVSHVHDVLGPMLRYNSRHSCLEAHLNVNIIYTVIGPTGTGDNVMAWVSMRLPCPDRHSHVGRVSHVGLHNVLGPTLSTGARLPRIRCTRPDTVNLVSHVHDILGPTLSTWSLTYTMYSARHCRLGRVSYVYDVLGPTLSTWSLTYTMYSARHCQLGLSRTRCTRPDTVDLVSHVHDVLGPTLSTWSLTYTMYSARHTQLGLSRTRYMDGQSYAAACSPPMTGVDGLTPHVWYQMWRAQIKDDSRLRLTTLYCARQKHRPCNCQINMVTMCITVYRQPSAKHAYRGSLQLQQHNPYPV